MKGEGKSSRRLTQVDAAGGETSVCVVTGLLYPQGESGAAATEKTRVLRVGCRAGIKIARGGRFVPSSPCYRLKLTGPLRPVHISIPALRAEGDFFEPDGQGQTFIPAFTQRVTGLAVPFVQGQQISTHTLRVEGDCPLPSTTSTRWTSFYPRPPHGGRLFPRGGQALVRHFYPRPHMEGDSKHAEVQACISAAYLKCSTRKAAASRRCAGLGGRVVLFHQLSRLVLGRARCEPRGEGMCDRGSHRQSGRRKGLKTHSSKMSSWLH